MQNSRSILGDGVNIPLFQLLWTRDEVGFCPPVNVPDTVVYKTGQAVAWYFTCKKGFVKKKQSGNLINSKIGDAFTKVNNGFDIIATLYSIENGEVRFLDRPALKDFLTVWKSFDGILQRFIEPMSNQNEIVRAIWSPKICLIEKRINIHKLFDDRYGLYERCITYEGPSEYSSAFPVRGTMLPAAVQRCCQTIATHIAEVTFQEQIPSRMVVNFKVDSNSKVWLLYTSCIRCDERNSQDAETSSSSLPAQDKLQHAAKVGRDMESFSKNNDNGDNCSMITLDSTFRLPENVTLSSIPSHTNTTQSNQYVLNRCISCWKDFHPKMFHKIDYKVVSQHYEHVVYATREAANSSQINQGVVEWPPADDILHVTGNVGFGPLFADQNFALKRERKLDDEDIIIPPIIRHLHPKLTVVAYNRYIKDPVFMYKKVDVCEECYLVYADLTSAILKFGEGIIKNADVSMASNLIEDEVMRVVPANRSKSSENMWRDMLKTNSKKQLQRRPCDTYTSSRNGTLSSGSMVHRHPSMPQLINNSSDASVLTSSTYQRLSAFDELSAVQTELTNESAIDDEIKRREEDFFRNLTNDSITHDQHPLMYMSMSTKKLQEEQAPPNMSRKISGSEWLTKRPDLTSYREMQLLATKEGDVAKLSRTGFGPNKKKMLLKKHLSQAAISNECDWNQQDGLGYLTHTNTTAQAETRKRISEKAMQDVELLHSRQSTPYTPSQSAMNHKDFLNQALARIEKSFPYIDYDNNGGGGDEQECS